MSTDSVDWFRFLGILALEAAVFAALAAVAAHGFHAGNRRRWVWQAALLATGITWFSELSGIRAAFGGGHRQDVSHWLAVTADFEARFDAVQRDAMLAHELSHVAARDGLWMAVADVVCGLAWWHPAVWWMRRRLRSDLELAADDASALVPGGRRALAETLVAFGREWKHARGGRALGVVGGLRSELARRVTALLEPGTRRLEPVRGRAGLTVAVAMAITGVALGIGGAGAENDSPLQVVFSEVRSRWVNAGVNSTEPNDRSAGVWTRFDASGRRLTYPDNAPNEGASEKPATPTVHLDIKVMEVNEREGTDLGLDWVFGETNGMPASFEVVPPAGYLPEVPAEQTVNFRIQRGRLEGRTVVLSPAQVSVLLRALESRGDVSIVAAPRVSTLSGRRAQIQVQDARTIVTGAQAIQGEGTNSARVQYTTAPMWFGPTVDIDPTYADGTWKLSVAGTLREFMGYDDPGKPGVVATSADGTEVTGQRPLPVLRVREAIGMADLKAKESLLLRGPAVREDVKSKGGWFRVAKVQTQQRRLYVLVTVDAVN